jgi:hypothetical protein
MNVDVDLYEFLKNHECHLFRERGEVKAAVMVDFDDLADFVKVVGIGHFDDGGLEVSMFDRYIAIEIIDIIEESFGDEFQAYKNCFDVSEWERYFCESGEQS